MGQVIILEGPDGGGKSTLSGQLAVAFEKNGPVHKVHHGPYPGASGEDLMGYYLDAMALAHGNRTVIMDRSWISEPIYGKVYRNAESRLKTWQVRMLERVALGYNGMIVNCLPPLEKCIDNYKARKGVEMLDNEDQLSRVYAGYCVYTSAVPQLGYDFRLNGSDDDGVSYIMSMAESSHFYGPNKGPGIGHFSPASVVLLGDTVNPNESVKFFDRDLPFVTIGANGCSYWLTEQLEEFGIREDQLYWANVTRSDGAPLSYHWLFDLKPKAVIAMGHHAARWCNSFGIDFESTNHPQFIKRFLSNKPERTQIVDAIATVIGG